MRPPGPPLPAVVQTLFWIARPLSFMQACRDMYGDVFTVRFTGLGAGRHITFIADPEGVREVFAGNPAQLRAGAANVALGALLGEHSLLVLDGREHLRQRKLMLPPFHGERMRAYQAVMREATESRMREWPETGVLEMLPQMQRITLDVIIRAVFGFEEPAEQARMRTMLQEMLALGSGSAQLAAMAFARVELGGRTPWGRFVAVKRRVDAALLAQIRRRRAAAEPRDDVLSLLLESRDEHGEPLSDEEMRDELMTLLVAGHETTATALAWTLDLLVHHPDALARLQASLDGGETAYVDAVIKESLRIRPVVPIVVRLLTEPFTVLGHTLPRGSVVAPCIYLTQRNPAVYEQPDHFIPERFLEQAPEPYAWLPFGGGVRRCLGASFAMVELRTVLSTILGSLSLSAAVPEMDETSRRAVTLVPRHGARVRLDGQRQPARELSA